MNYLKILFAIGIMATFASCKKFSDFQTNPNLPTTADPSSLLPNIEVTAFSHISADADLASRYLVYTQSKSLTQYYNWTTSGMSYGNITQVVKMEQEAARVGKTNYRYLGKFFRAYYIVSMTEAFGDIPYSQMMQSIENNNYDSAATKPVYDKQHDIYLAILNDLKIASDSLSDDNGSITNDIIYGGNITKWKKLINSYRLRILMNLSKKESDATLNIKQRFNDIASNPSKYPIFESNGDNGQLQYYALAGNRYPYFNSNSMKTDYYLDSSFVQILQQLKDPRLFVFAQQTPNTSNSLPFTDFSTYGGLWGSAPLDYNTTKRGKGTASQINNRYSYDSINEPSLLMGYSEVEFLLAEAAIRGWISGSANTYYMNGINASLEFSNYKNTNVTAGFYTSTDIQNYVAQPSLALQSGKEIEQIITQKYISMFMQCSWQPFYEQRRTGFPKFDVSGGGVTNLVNGAPAVAKRWDYPTDEYTNNTTNVNNAVQSQYPNGDNINGIMWLIQ